jgi:hypothetical protein
MNLHFAWRIEAVDVAVFPWAARLNGRPSADGGDPLLHGLGQRGRIKITRSKSSPRQFSLDQAKYFIPCGGNDGKGKSFTDEC